MYSGTFEHETQFSIEHLAYSLVPGKIDRKIYEALLKEGIATRHWVVVARLGELTALHPGDEEYTRKCLLNLIKLKLIVTVRNTLQGTLYLVPMLRDWIPEPCDAAVKYHRSTMRVYRGVA